MEIFIVVVNGGVYFFSASIGANLVIDGNVVVHCRELLSIQQTAVGDMFNHRTKAIVLVHSKCVRNTHAQ